MDLWQDRNHPLRWGNVGLGSRDSLGSNFVSPFVTFGILYIYKMDSLPFISTWQIRAFHLIFPA